MPLWCNLKMQSSWNRLWHIDAIYKIEVSKNEEKNIDKTASINDMKVDEHKMEECKYSTFGYSHY